MKLNGKRKFVVAMTALIMSFVLALKGGQTLSGGEWVACIGLIVGLYGAAEAAEGHAHARSHT